MRNYLDDLKKYIDYSSILYLINIISRTRNIELYTPEDRYVPRDYKNHSIVFEYNGKEYTVSKFEDSVRISCSDGRLMFVNNEFYEKRGYKENEIRSNIYAYFKINNKSYLSTKKIDYDWLKNDYDVEQLKEDDISNKKLVFSAIWSTSSLSRNNASNDYNFINEDVIDYVKSEKELKEINNNEGISIGKYVVSPDFENIISYNGMKMPTREEWRNGILYEQDSYTVDTSYRQMRAFKEACEFRDRLVNGEIKDIFFTKDEMNEIVNRLYDRLEKDINKFEDDFTEYSINVKNEREKNVDNIISQLNGLLPNELDRVEQAINNRRRK